MARMRWTQWKKSTCGKVITSLIRWSFRLYISQFLWSHITHIFQFMKLQQLHKGLFILISISSPLCSLSKIQFTLIALRVLSDDVNSRDLHEIGRPANHLEFSVETGKFSEVGGLWYNNFCAPFRKYTFFLLICIGIKRTFIFSFGRKHLMSFSR